MHIHDCHFLWMYPVNNRRRRKKKRDNSRYIYPVFQSSKISLIFCFSIQVNEALNRPNKVQKSIIDIKINKSLCHKFLFFFFFWIARNLRIDERQNEEKHHHSLLCIAMMYNCLKAIWFVLFLEHQNKFLPLLIY